MIGCPACGCDCDGDGASIDSIEWDRVGEALGSGDLDGAIEAMERELEGHSLAEFRCAVQRGARLLASRKDRP